MFDPQGERGAFIKGLEPQGDEQIIEKRMPNAFNDTGLQIPTGLALHPGERRLRHPRPADRGRHYQRRASAKAEMAIMNDNFATLTLTQNLI